MAKTYNARKRKVKKNVPYGEVHIHTTFNNTVITVTDKEGNTVKVGSGFSKELREEIWKNPDSYIGKIIEVQYFEETENQNGGKGLRFPVFNDFRDPSDKNTPDF